MNAVVDGQAVLTESNMRELIAFVAVTSVVFYFLWKIWPESKDSENAETSFEKESDLMMKMRWVTKHYHIETDPFQTLLTTCYRVRMNRDNIFIDLCDDFFAGFHTLTYTKEGTFIGEYFNAYHPEPTGLESSHEGGCPSGLLEGEAILRWPLQSDPESDHFAQFR